MGEESEAGLTAQTVALGQMLKAISEDDPHGTPSARAAAAFSAWVAEAGPVSREPGYFTDVAANYRALENSNKDLWDLFDLLGNYIEIEYEPEEDAPPKTFIGLPLVSG